MTTVALITGAGWLEPVADTLLMRTTMVSVTIMRLASAGAEDMDAVLADADTVAGADADTVAGADAADNKRNPLCGANRRRSGLSNGIPILSGGSVQYI